MQRVLCSLVGIVVLSSTAYAVAVSNVTTVRVEWGSSPLFHVSPNQLSIAFDNYAFQPGVMARKALELTAPIQSMIGAVGPVVLRVSGTGAESYQFEVDQEDTYVPYPPEVMARRKSNWKPVSNVTRSSWSALVEFAKAAYLTLFVASLLLTLSSSSPTGSGYSVGSWPESADSSLACQWSM